VRSKKQQKRGILKYLIFSSFSLLLTLGARSRTEFLKIEEQSLNQVTSQETGNISFYIIVFVSVSFSVKPKGLNCLVLDWADIRMLKNIFATLPIFSRALRIYQNILVRYLNRGYTQNTLPL
jgi:hypothetical protein